jgi:anti-anti-sigma regulatory factor
MPRQTSQVTISGYAADAVSVLTVGGVLDSSTYRTLRDSVIKAALDGPDAVVVDISALVVPSPSAWSVFTSARWHVSTWPDVPVILACEDAAVRKVLADNGITRYVPVYATVDEACAAPAREAGHATRRRVKLSMPAALTSLGRARNLVADSLAAWSQDALIPVTNVIVTTLIENVLQHTDSAPVAVLETDGTTVTVTVQDTSSVPAVRREHPAHDGHRVSGLAVISALCRSWGSTPSTSGKTVWAVIGPENKL